jgi:predicted dinucleotide-binding enzyme
MGVEKKVGILGSGEVARSLAIGFATLGHHVMLSNRDKPQPELLNWAQRTSPLIQAGSFMDAAAFGELLVLATYGLATEQAIRRGGIEHFDQKLVLDTTNPLDFSSGFPPTLAGGVGDSGGERIQRLLSQSKVVKVFNTVGNKIMFKPQFVGGRPDMFICGDSIDAKIEVVDLLDGFGWNAVDVGAMDSAHYLEAMAMVWILSASYAKPQRWEQAFKMLQRTA